MHRSGNERPVGVIQRRRLSRWVTDTVQLLRIIVTDCHRSEMAASIYDNRRQGIQSKGKRDLVRFALSGLSCMCAATGKLLYFNICSLRKLNCLHFICNLRVLRYLEGTSCLFDHWIRHRKGILECYKHSCGQITWWNHNVEEYWEIFRSIYNLRP